MDSAINTILGIQREIYRDSKNKTSIEDQLIQALRADAEGLEENSTDNQQVIKKQEEMKEGEQDQITEKKEENSAK